MKKMKVDLARLYRARELLVTDETTDILLTTLEGLGVELSNRWRSVGQVQGLSQAMQDYLARARAVSDAIIYASERLTEVFIRHRCIDWMRNELAYETNPDIFAQASDPKAQSWRLFMGLAIKDFHVDIGSLMDALAPVIIQAKGKLKSKDKSNLPGWADIQSGTKRSYREQLAVDLCAAVDSTDRWWPGVKKVRDLLTHRKHDRIIFGNYEDGILFQVYDESRHPKIVLPQVLYGKGKNVVDFDLYSAFILAEVVTLLDELGKIIAPKLQISETGLAQRCLRVVDKSVGQSIERLIRKNKGQGKIGKEK